MCGIAGIIQQDASRYHTEHTEAMASALAHRGPDGQATWANPSNLALLAHRRLAIIDLSASAAQPMHYLHRYSIVHNGEIYNYLELRKQLETKGYQFTTQSDTEVILAAYDQWNSECLAHFDGMFAFAIWDEQEKELFAARDRFGEKPFFYCIDGKSFLFASEIKAIWSAGIPKLPNQQLLFNFLTIGYADNPTRPDETFYTNILKLPAASYLYYSVGDNEAFVEKYWDIDPDVSNKAINDQQAIEKLCDLLTTSVSRRLRSDVSVGTSLSGGIDSSSIAAVIHSLQQRLHSFSAVFPGFEKDESVYIKQVADTFQLNASLITVTADDLDADWNTLCFHQDEPFGSASIYIQYKVFELAKQHNVTVLLDGQGADEILAGYHKYYKWYWQELFMRRKLISSGELAAARSNGVEEKFGWKNMIAAFFPDLASVMLERQYLFRALNHEDLTRDFVRSQSREAYYSTPANFNLNGALYFNTLTHGLEELLRYADRNSMAHGRETRLPFLNHELVQFIFSLPSHFKIRNGWTKWILRKAMEEKLPDAIVWRKDKIGFEPPQQQWMQHPHIQDRIQEAKKKLIAEKILRPSVIDDAIVATASHSANNYAWRYLSAAEYL